MEGVVHDGEKTDCTTCWKMTWKTPYLMRLALSAGIGGLLFGYDTGVISGALLYIRDDFKSVQKHTWLQETIVSMTVAGAILGAAFGGLLNDKYGRKKTMLFSDVLFFVGSVVMSSAPSPWVIIIGRIFVGLGVGMASMTSPLYISEASPSKIRGALVSTNGLLLTGGQFLSYLINLAFTKAPGTWRWMLGVACIPAVLQFVLMIFLPESPRWLYRKKRVEEARAILEKIYPADEVEKEMQALQTSVEVEIAEQQSIGGGFFSRLKFAWGNAAFRRGLYAGITVQVVQQFAGINSVMYYSPTIVQLAGFASNKTAMALSLITTGLNTIGTVISMSLIDRFGRRRLMIVSVIGIVSCLCVLSLLFAQASSHSPAVSFSESIHFGSNSTCPSLPNDAQGSKRWNCMACLKASSDCAFCSNGAGKYRPGACLANSDPIRDACHAEHRTWYAQGCPTKFGIFAVLLLGLYIISYAPGMGTVPWIVNSEIYPLKYRGLGGGIAAVSNWISNLIVSESFLSLTEKLGSSGTFLLFAGISSIGLVFMFFLVPETKGMQFEEVEKMLEKGYKPSFCDYGKKKKKEREVEIA